MSDVADQNKKVDQKSSGDDQPAQAAPASSSGTDKYGRTLYKTVCAGCGGEATVPFQPTSGRPVYCQNCYKPKPRGNFGGPRSGNRSFGDRGH